MLGFPSLWKKIRIYCIIIFLMTCIGPFLSDNAIKTDAAKEGAKETLPVVHITNAFYKTRSSLVLTWEKNDDVDGYIIYGWRKNGDLIVREKIKGSDTDSGVVDNLKYNTPYTFSVAAFREDKGKMEKGTYKKMEFKTRIKVTEKDDKGYRYFFDWNGNRIEDNINTLLGDTPVYQIRVNTVACVTTVYARSQDGTFDIPVKAWLCSPGQNNSTASGTWKLGKRYRYRPLLYGTNSQWAVRIHDEILFHTTPYGTFGTNNTMDVEEYNKLGTQASHGCIRMQCEAVEWISVNCPEDTEVVIYKDDDPGALGKPEFEPLPSWHTWDPTDHPAKEYCEQNSCHR